MSDRDEEVTIVAPVSMTPEQRAAHKKRIVTALERGIVHDFLNAKPNAGLHAQWVRRNQFSVDRLKDLGFWVARPEDVGVKAVNTDGTDSIVAMDVVLMVTTKENFEIIEEVRREEFMQNHGKPSDPKAATKEERDFKANVESEGDIGVLVDSRTKPLEMNDLLATAARQSTK